MKTVILTSGYKRAGKDTVSEIIVDILKDFNAKSISLAEPMKEIIADTFGTSLGTLETAKNEPHNFPILCKHINVEVPYNRIDTNMREILQRFGTEAMKKQFGNDVWCKLAYDKIDSDVTIISDWRFKSELEYFKNKPDVKVVTIRVIRDNNFSTIDTHSSEVDLENVKVDFVISNITDNLYATRCQVEAILDCIPLQSDMMEYFDYFKCGYTEC